MTYKNTYVWHPNVNIIITNEQNRMGCGCVIIIFDLYTDISCYISVFYWRTTYIIWTIYKCFDIRLQNHLKIQNVNVLSNRVCGAAQRRQKNWLQKDAMHATRVHAINERDDESFLFVHLRNKKSSSFSKSVYIASTKMRHV